MPSLAEVEVRATRGVINLFGDVTSLFVDNQLVVRPLQPKSPEQLEAAISHSLQSDPAAEAFDIGVEAYAQGKVTLTGRVGNWAEGEMVERAAKSIGGVTQVTNEIRIDAKAAARGPALARDIERMLRWDAYLAGASIDAEAQDAAVTLSGTVSSSAQKVTRKVARAAAGRQQHHSEALELVGVTDDDGRGNRSSERVSSDVSDRDLAEAVGVALGRSPRLASTDVDVHVDDGVVTLRPC